MESLDYAIHLLYSIHDKVALVMGNNHNHDEQHEQQQHDYQKENFHLFEEPYVPTTYDRMPESGIAYGRFVYCLGIVVIGMYLISDFHEYSFLIKRLLIMIAVVEGFALLFGVPWRRKD